MKVTDLIAQLQKLPDDYDIKIPAHLDFAVPDVLLQSKIEELDVNYIVLPITEIETVTEDKYAYLLFDIEEYIKYDYIQQQQAKMQKGH
jgi:hypothetical protein